MSPVLTPSEAFYSPISRFWEILLGGALAIVVRDMALKESKIRSHIISIFGAVLIVAIMFVPNLAISWLSWLALVPVLGTVLVIAAGQKSIIDKHILSNKYLAFVGLISCPLYLWHWPLLSFSKLVGVTEYRFIYRPIICRIAFIISWLTYKYVEVPIRGWRSKTSIG